MTNKFFIIPILVIGFLVRLYGFSNPIADWHSWRQADTSSVSRNFINSGFDLLHPRFDDLSNVPSTIDNPEGYRFVEFPIYNLLQAGGYKLTAFLSLEEWGRLVTIFSSLAASLLLFLLVRRYQSNLAALLSSFFFTFLPYSIYYGRTILPDPSMVAALLAGVYFFDLWTDEKTKRKSLFFILSALFTATALLLKPFAVFFTLPMVYLAFKKYGLKAFKHWQLYVYAILSLTPFLLWRIWMLQFPEGIPQSGWLLNGDHIRFKGAYFYWVFGERIGKVILGYWGLVILALGILTKVRRDKLFPHMFLISSLLYVVVVAKGNVQHDYYQYPILPTLAIFMGLGGEYLLRGKDWSYRFIGPIIFIFCTGLSLMLGWYHIRDYYHINNPHMLSAAAAVDRLVPKNAKVLANYEGDTTFLYNTNRKGWASYEHDSSEMIELGADYLAIVDPRQSDLSYASGFKIVEKTPEYIIFDLHSKE